MASAALCRGPGLFEGSWRPIGPSLPRRRRSRDDRAGRDRSFPHARIDPAVSRSSPTIIFAMVVLPEPDSPTIASDPPAGIENDTSSTAVKSPNVFRSPEAMRTGSGIGGLQLAAQLGRPDAPGHAAVE